MNKLWDGVKMMQELGNFFPETCTIKRAGSSTTGAVERDAAGNPRKGGGSVVSVAATAYSGIPCRVAQQKEIERVDFGNSNLSTHSILLQGYYAGIAPGMIAVIGTVTYNILAEDSAEETATKLIASTSAR